MADEKISQLSELTTVDPDDLLAIVDDPSGTPITKKIKIKNISALVLISETITSGSATSVSFTSIPSVFRDLVIVVRARGDNVSTTVELRVRANNDTGNNYDYIIENRFGIASGNAVSFMRLGDLPAASMTADYASGLFIEVYNYKGTTFYKECLSYCGQIEAVSAGGMYITRNAGWWRSLLAINRIDLFLSAGNFVNDSIVSLYGRF